MDHSRRRRTLVMAAMTLPFAPAYARAFGAAAALPAGTQQLHTIAVLEALATLEASASGRLGLSAINTANGMRVQYRADERFPLCSTFKTVAVAAILKRSEQDKQLLRKHIAYDKKDVDSAGYAPVTGSKIASGMSIEALCAATMQHSDNTAVNLLMREIGGPQAVTAFARALGDRTFRLDRWEPELNAAIPGDPRDTSTPSAMETTLQRLVLGKVLAPPQRQLLTEWLKGNTTGNERIRAGAPHAWVVGDKTGTGSYGTTADIGVLWPPTTGAGTEPRALPARASAPIVASIYFTQLEYDARPRDDVIAAATRILVRALVDRKHRNGNGNGRPGTA